MKVCAVEVNEITHPMLILHKHCMGIIGCINSAAVGHTYIVHSLLYCNSTLKMGAAAAHIMFSGHAINMKQHENVTFI